MLPNSLLVYDGPSKIDGRRIIVILSGLASNSGNAKTGAMVQSWILCASADPISASRTGADVSICGDCPLRGIAEPEKSSGCAKSRGCYVNLLHGPQSIWNAWARGNIETATPKQAAALLAGRKLRLGSYGDPAAVPPAVWRPMLAAASGWTGYSHQHKLARHDWTMASVETHGQALELWNKGARTFRVVSDVAEVDRAREVLCPASAEAGKRSTCETCGLCMGTATSAKSIAIVAHGTGKAHAFRVLQ
jgi:hypothetical protein